MTKPATRQYLKDGDRVFSTGCFLVYNKKNNCFQFDGIEDDTFCDGELVYFDENSKPFVTEV